jgi:ribonuclease Z
MKSRFRSGAAPRGSDGSFLASPADDPAFRQYAAHFKTAVNTSHTPQGAFGYLLSQISPLPRLTVATHFPVADDTVNCAMSSVRAHVPNIGELGEKIVWSFDTMVIRVFAGNPKPAILQQVVSPISDFTFAPFTSVPNNVLPPKYEDPFAQST